MDVTTYLLFTAFVWTEIIFANEAKLSGVKVKLTNHGLEHLSGVKMRDFKDKLITNAIRTVQSGQGDMEYTLNVTINDIEVKRHSFILKPNYGFQFQLGWIDIHALVSLNIKDTHEASTITATQLYNVTAAKTNVSFTVALNAKNGHPYITILSCTSDIGKVTLQPHQLQSPLDSTTSDLLINKLRTLFEEMICKQGRKFEKMINNMLPKMPIQIHIMARIYLDLSLLKTLVTKRYIEFQYRGEFHNSKNPIKSQLEAPHLDITDFVPSKMISIWISAFSLNRAVEVLFNSNMLGKTIDPRVTTSGLGYFLPQVYKEYPNRPIIVGIETLESPRFFINEKNIIVQLNIRAYLNVLAEGNMLKQIFHIDINIKGKVTPLIHWKNNKMAIGGGIMESDIFKTDLKVGGSKIGELDLPLEPLQMMIGGYIVDMVNPLLSKGFPIPQVDCFKYKHPSIMLSKDGIRIDTDILYHTEQCN